MWQSIRYLDFDTVSYPETGRLIGKICKRYSLKKSEVGKLAFRYLEKANMNPADAPEFVKSELFKVNERQDGIIRFIRNYEEEEFAPMVCTSHSIVVEFDTVVGGLSKKIDLEIATSKAYFCKNVLILIKRKPIFQK